MANEVTLQDIYSSDFPNAKQAYQTMAIYFAKMALGDAMRKSNAYPNVLKMQDEPFTVTYTVTVTVSNLANMVDHQTIEVTAAETSISE